MRRLAIAPRPNWRELAERSGFGTHPPIGAPYWVDGAFYAFTADQIERHIEPATAELIAMCLTVVERASTDDEVLATLKIPQAWWDPIRDSWRRGERSLSARFDLAYDGSGAAKMLECNGDVLGMMFESGLFQWLWLDDALRAGAIPSGTDQYNRLHSALVEACGRLLPENATCHFAASRDNVEDRLAADYLRDCAHQAGRRTAALDIEAIGVDRDGRFTDLDDRVITHLVKLYRWDLLIREPFGSFLQASAAPRMIEPMWTMILSSKGILPWLWRMFPGHPNLLPAWFDDDAEAQPGSAYVVKPLRSVKGANVSIVAPHLTGGVLSTDGPYGAEGHIVQAYNALPVFCDSAMHEHHALVGSWVVDGEPCGMCMVEDNGPIISHATIRFVPHVVLP